MIRDASPLLLVLGLTPAVAAVAAPPPASDSLSRDQVHGPVGAQLDSQLTRFADYGFSGTVLVVREGRILLLKGYGLADVERGVPNTAATRFEMNSITKLFTGIAILQLAAQGRLRLSDPVARYLDGFPPSKQRATIEQLAMHTAGLIPAGAALAENSRDAFRARRGPCASRVGARRAVSLQQRGLLASGGGDRERDRGVVRRLPAPPRLRTSRDANRAVSHGGADRSSDSSFAKGYVGTPAALEPGPPNPYGWGTKGAGGVWTTVGDMTRCVAALEARRLLPEAQWRLLLAPPPPPAEEAFGWHVRTVDGRPRADKGGGSDDFASQLLYWPHERVVIVWASNNLRQRWRRTLNQAVSGIVFGERPASLPPVAPIDRATLDSREHVYSAGQDSLDLRAGTGYLYAAANALGVPANVMFFPQDRDHFTGFDPATGSRTRLEFTPDRHFVTVVLPDGRSIRAGR